MAYQWEDGSVSEINVTRVDGGFRITAQTKFPKDKWGNELPNLLVKTAAEVGVNVTRLLNETYQRSFYVDEQSPDGIDNGAAGEDEE